MRNTIRIVATFLLTPMLAVLAGAASAMELEREFANPPPSARPHA